ncbi:MAG TPA: hypothetical protein G4N92_00030 [Anaerolineae bacterium]|nr:hypothetical protein [Anaerolineae bacterium]
MQICITKESIKKFQIDAALLTANGFLPINDFQTARIIAAKVNEYNNRDHKHADQLKGYQVRALGQLVLIYRSVLSNCLAQYPNLQTEWIDWLYSQFSKQEVNQWFSEYKRNFLCLKTASKQDVLKEIFLMWIILQNPALSFTSVFFKTKLLSDNPTNTKIFSCVFKFLKQSAPSFDNSYDFIDWILQPIKRFPESLADQLVFIRNNWWNYLDNSKKEINPTLKFIHEEILEDEKRAHAPERVLTFKGRRLKAKYSHEKSWMRDLVMIAKNTYVWLNQLSKTYNKPIRYLDHIPDEELEALHESGITGLWLIGIWERSKASKRIKELYGNKDAIASAYSIYEYKITENLGGEKAYQNLKDRAKTYGIRLGSDMVPNHTGIDSPWVIEHPEWFISLDTNPKKEFSFNSPELSPSTNVSIKLEEHYYSQTGAAEVFQHIDLKNNHTRYIYHGNDGTSMSWNDTAQLNYLKPEVRDIVKRTILNVAKNFSIIRFDAAMTLAKRHHQRLWFPLPGTPDCVITRERHTMSQQEFDKHMPQEFWREVVDCIAEEAPDTLLLAEAFWLMEGYFVRELGMHRVYNSAFMNLLRDEENAKYRQLLKNTLDYDPRILGRFVNFMNNPDERTAVDQFGKGNKYFGICTMMATMPGLPLIGHGQIEGFTERYGMDFKKAKWDEDIDQELVQRHKKEIFPLLRKRVDFAGTDHFTLYDFEKEDGGVDENVFAYSNQNDGRVYLVIFNNSYQTTRGSIKRAVECAGNNSRIQDKSIMNILGGLSLSINNKNLFILSDLRTGKNLEYKIDKIKDNGLFFKLEPYEVNVFLVKTSV